MTLTAILRRMKVDAVPHGFRSTFRDWASERTNYPAMPPKWHWRTPSGTRSRRRIDAATSSRSVAA